MNLKGDAQGLANAKRGLEGVFWTDQLEIARLTRALSHPV
jgi:hypothetical protein